MPPSANAKPSLMGAGKGRKAPAPAQPANTEPLRWYRVLKDKQVPLQRGQTLLREGKEVNSANFDVGKLRNLGVQLEEIETPPWFLQQQRESVDRHGGLVEAGHDLGDHPPEYESPGLASAKAATSPST